MTRDLKEAAETALMRFEEPEYAAGRVERMTVHVALGGEQELVALRFVGGDLRWSCTCLESSCAHVRVALSAIADGRDPSTGRITEIYDAPASSAPPSASVPPLASSIPPLALEPALASEKLAALSEALDDVVTAIVRVGIDSLEAPTVRDSLERLLQAAPEPLPLGLSRWIGRLRIASDERDVDALARVLAGATRLSDDLRAEHPSESARQRMVSWLGKEARSAGAVYQLSDRTMLEVGREFLDGTDRGGIERRYLLDLDAGEVYREERPRGRPAASLGTCPRIVHVGLAEVERAAEPRRIRLLQYVSVPVLTAGHWGQMQNWALRAFVGLPERYRIAVEAFPGLSEPFVVVAPERHVSGTAVSLLDDAGHALPLTGGQEPAVLEFFETDGQGRTPTWIAGRLVDRSGVISLRPVSMGYSDHGDVQHVRF